MFTTVFAHVFLTATGHDTRRLPKFGDTQARPENHRKRPYEKRENLAPAFRETREQFKTPAPPRA